MVRVISVHHFVSQDIHTCEDPVAAVVAPPERLLLALPQHVIEVRDLARGGDVAFTFPSVDQVHHMLHCSNGNYVATLETKQTRQGKETMYARIYANWDVLTHVNQPMRARIAGRVTPSSAQSGPPSLEMIELPMKRAPHIIACCQTTGNLLVASHSNLVLFHYLMRTHDISRLRFLDFEEVGTSIELSFKPIWMSLAEDFVLTGSRERMHLFQLVFQEGHLKQTFQTYHSASETLPEKENNNKNSDDVKYNNEKHHIDLDAILKKQLTSSEMGLHPNSFPLTLELPSVAAERAANSFSSSSGSSPSTSVTAHRQSPFQVGSSDMTVNIKCSSPAAPPWSTIRDVIHLLQLQITSIPQQANSILYTENHDEFHGLIMKPIYLTANASEHVQEQKENAGSNTNPLRSCNFGRLASIECIIVTQQEGYHYHFPLLPSQEKNLVQQAACVTIYPFTAHVQEVAMERFFLHALTETGLETYTVRIGHHLVSDLGIGGSKVCPSATNPICLVGLRPFLGVEHLLLAESHIVLLACSEGSSLSSQDSQGGGWTLYSLALPHPSACYRDMLAVGSVHRWTSPSTYNHLLGEGHMLLRVALNTLTWHPGGASELAVLTELDPVERSMLEGLYQESCALLADYNISSEAEEEWKLARSYYLLAGLTPIQVVERVSNMQIQTEGDSSSKKNKRHLYGLIVYLRQSLIALGHETGDILFSPTLPSFAHTLLDLFEELDPAQVSTIVLHSALLRECATDRVLGIMKKQLKTRAVPEATDALALVLLCIQKGSPDQALAVLQSLSSSGLNCILLANPSLLIEAVPAYDATNLPSSQNNTHKSSSSFSELAALLMDSKPFVLAHVLTDLITVSHLYTLQEILQMFLDYIPSCIGISGSTTSQALKLFLEHYFAWYFNIAPENKSTSGKLECTAATIEALKILVRSYLSDLQCYELIPAGLKREPYDPHSEIIEKVLWEEHHFEYLNKMPPFAADLSHRLISLQEGYFTDETDSMSKARSKDIPNSSLFKLQCLLSCAQLPNECLMEVHKYVQTNPRLYGSLSLQVLCVPTHEAVSILLDFCPQAILQFAKEIFINETEWKYLVFLLHRKVHSLKNDNLLKPYYMKIRKDMLTHLAQTMSLEVLARILPPGDESTYHAYMQVCQQMTHANHIRALIMATGQQLLSTLNLSENDNIDEDNDVERAEA